jgi:hypothetical protein
MLRLHLRLACGLQSSHTGVLGLSQSGRDAPSSCLALDCVTMCTYQRSGCSNTEEGDYANLFSNSLNHESKSPAYLDGTVRVCHGEVVRDCAAAVEVLYDYHVAAQVRSRAQDVVLLIAFASLRLSICTLASAFPFHLSL